MNNYLQTNKRLLALLFALLIGIGTAWAQEEFTVCDGTRHDERIPMTGYHADKYGKHEFVYPQDLLTPIQGTGISSLRFYSTSTTDSWGNAIFRVFMKTINTSTISDYQGYEYATIVYEGPLSVAEGVMDIQFTTPYYYSAGNLLIGVYQIGQGNSSSCWFYGQTVNGASLAGWNENSLENILSSNAEFPDFLPKTTFSLFNVSGNGDITVSISPEGSGAGVYEVGNTCTLIATANDGYTFVNWTENGNIVSYDAEYSFTVTGERNLVANFYEGCPINIELYDSYGDGYTGNYLVVSYGDVTEQLTVESGSSASHTLFVPDGSHVELGWIVGNWPEDCSFTISYANGNVIYHGENLNSSFSFGFDMDCEGIPTTTFNITATAEPAEGGTVSGAGEYDYGTQCTVTATANEGYGFANWMENGSVVSTEAEYNFTVAGDRELVANFVSTAPIVFADDNVKAICVANWDTDDDGELSYAEAAAVTNLGEVFSYNGDIITSFDELQYFVNLTSIGGNAFFDCINLTSIEIPNSVTSIGDYAFFECYNLTSIEIPNSVTSIGWYAFSHCGGLTSIEIPNSVTSIGGYAFEECTGLTSIEIPNSVTSIGDAAFAACNGLTQIVVENGNSVYDSRDNCNAIIETATNSLIAGCQTTVIPSTVTSIGNYAFIDCYNLISIEIPNSVTSIGNSAFYYCGSLTSIEIPNSVTSIGYYAFLGCTGLTEITMLRTDVPTLWESVFNNTNDCPIYVPYESLNNYKTTENWSEYEYRIYPMAYIAVSGYGTGGGKWKFIASPLTEETEPTAVSNMTGTEYDLYRFNQIAELEWENYKVHDFDLVNGQGYLYANTEDVNLVFKGTFNEGSSQTITLIYDEGKDFAGWNLVGNPFPVQAYANRSYYTMNAAGTVIEPTAASTSTAIPACTGVMVKAETTGQSVTFSKTAPSAATNNGALQIAVAQANTRGAAVQDKAIVSFNAGDELGKFYFGESNAKLYIPQNGKELAIAYVCTDAARHVSTNEVPLNFKAEKNGEYTLSFDVANVIASEAKQSNLSEQFAYLHLIDNMNGADVDLLVSPEYTFNAKTSDYASRFRLVFSANESDGDNDGDNAFAYVDAGGNLVINGEGTLQVIDVTGRVIVSRDGVHTVSTNGMVPGMYILRLINGENVMTQKIVIE